MIEDFIEEGKHFTPQLGKNAWVHDSAVVIGKVSLGEDVSVWPCAVMRGDVNHLTVGKKSNIQDGSIIHATHPSAYNEEGYATTIGEEVTVGHRAILHGCFIGNRVLVGMGSTILDGAVVSDDIIIGANSLVPMHKKLDSGYLYLGSPVTQIRKLSEEEMRFLHYSASHYATLKNKFQNKS